MKLLFAILAIAALLTAGAFALTPNIWNAESAAVLDARAIVLPFWLVALAITIATMFGRKDDYLTERR